MKRILLSLSVLLIGINFSMAQVNVGGTPYANLGAAFTAINAGTHTGAITISITGNTVETATATLNASGSGLASYSSVLISPTGGPWTISGSISGNLIDLNGADNVTINGANNLVISNAGTGSASTIRLFADAKTNTFTNLGILGSGTIAGGVVNISSGTVDGNDGNTFDGCKIGPAGVNLPLCGIYSGGTSATIDNSGNTITNCEIFNHFNAGTASFGINVNTGSNSWTITNNKIYQTATRTYTSAVTSGGITVLTGTGYTISNNTIGFANPSGTGVTAMTATVALRYIAINCTFTAASGTNNIQGNTIAGFTLGTSSGAATTTGIFCGINVTSGNANIGTTTGNTIGVASGINSIVCTPTTTQGTVVGIHSGSANTIDIRNNIIGGLTSSGTTAAVAGGVFGINISTASAACTISNNTIGNATTDNMRAGTTSVVMTGSSIAAGINIAAALSTANFTINQNTIQNINSIGTGGTGYVRGIAAISGMLGIANITNNTVSNITTNATLATITNGASVTAGIMLGAGALGCSISGNTIFNISATNNTAVSTYSIGIISANATSANIFKNKIYGISNASTSVAQLGGTATGIIVRSATTSINIYNNMISLSGSPTAILSGIMANYGSTPNGITNIYHNSIYITGTASSSQPSFGVVRTDLSATTRTPTMDVRNNIIVNDRTGGTGKHFAISNNYGATVSTTGWAGTVATGMSNFNLLKADPTSIGNWGGTAALDFTNWKSPSGSGSDANSFSNKPVTFVTTSTADLHLNMGTTTTTLESGGTTIAGYSTDFDGDSRPGPAGSTNGGATAPDLGADEFDGAPADEAGPNITVTPVGVNCATTDRTFTATMTDYTGVASGTFAPRVYYKKGVGGTWFSQPGTMTSGSPNNGTWTFTIVHADMGGVASLDNIYYYVIAQDVNGFLTSKPVGAIAADVNTVTTHPTNPSLYQIGATLSGTYLIGAAQPAPYTTLTSAINTYNNACLSGAVVFELEDASYSASETFPLVINKHQDASSVNTLTIKPKASTTTTISGAVNNGTIFRILNNFTTIDGSNAGTLSRDLTITNTSLTSPNVIQLYSDGAANSITNDAVKNCIIINGITSSSAIIINDLLGTTGGYFKNILIQNNDIRKAYIGIYCLAFFNPGLNGTGVNISANKMNNLSPDQIRLVAIYCQGLDGVVVENNTIGEFESLTGESDRGIWLASGTINATVFNNTITNMACTSTSAVGPTAIYLSPGLSSGSANITVSNNTISGISAAGTGSVTIGALPCGISASGGIADATISNNKISNIKSSNSSGFMALGILVGSSFTTNAGIVIRNNFISDVAAYGTAGLTSNGHGIYFLNGTGISILNNTILMNTNQTLAGSFPTALTIASANTNVGALDVRNNIFACKQTGGSTERICIYNSMTSTIFSAIDNNCYFTTGPTIGYSTASCANIAAMQTNFGGNTKSFVENPVFVSATDLHLNTGLTGTRMESGGSTVAAVTTDIDGDVRPGPVGSVNGGGTVQDVGADEFDGAPICQSIIGSLPTTNAAANTSITCEQSGWTYYGNNNNNFFAINWKTGNSAAKTAAVVSQYYNTAGAYTTLGSNGTSSVNTMRRYWNVDIGSNTIATPVDVRFFYNQSELDAITTAGTPGTLKWFKTVGTAFDPTNTALFDQVTGSWISMLELTATNGTLNGTPYVQFDGVTSFSGGTAATSSGTLATPLPITLKSFTATEKGAVNEIVWETELEKNVKEFVVEKSTNGKTWSKMNSLNANLNKRYTTEDKNPSSLTYYRLLTIDNDGRTNYSNVVNVLRKTNTFNIINLYPNPTNSNVTMSFESINQEEVKIQIVDVLGKVVLSETSFANKGINNLNINTAILPNGSYTIQLSNSSTILNKNLIKQ